MNLYIKNMVCPRCIAAVRSILQQHGAEVSHIQLGLAISHDEITDKVLAEIKKELSESGFELLSDYQTQLVEQIKSLIIDQIYNSEHTPIVISLLLTDRLNKDYSYLSKLFSATEGITIEQYTILQKTERIKELLSYNQLTLGEIADRMGYSSVAHISSQFKKITGMTPTQFKAQGLSLRKPIDEI